jgi:Zn-dependent protease with chaperone function
MIEFQADYFDGITATAHKATVRVSGHQLEVNGLNWQQIKPIADLRIEPVLGRTSRVLKFRTGEKLISSDFAAIAQLETMLGVNKGMTFVHRIEQHWRWVLVSFIALVLVSGFFVRFGVPWIARQAAFATPIPVLKTMTDSAFNGIDGQLLKPSRLSQTRTNEIQSIFTKVHRAIGKNYPYRLELRRGDSQIGANAFALPSGTIVMTDELIALSRNDQEIEAVLAHEIGHVTERHGIRNLYQSVGLVLLAGVFIGDFTSVVGLGSSLPVLLLQSGYSQEFEFQSDEIAGRYLLKNYGSTQAMQQMLGNLEQSRGESKEDDLNIFKTHPITPARIKALAELK